MSTGTVSAGSAGFRNLRAMFENKSNDHSTSPPSRGRSPNCSVSSQASRQVSKVRTSFVAVERPGGSSQSPQRAFRKFSDVSSMAEVREEAIMEGPETTSAKSVPQDTPLSSAERTSLGAILKGSPFEAHPSTAIELPRNSTSGVPEAKTNGSPKKLETNGTSDKSEVAGNTGSTEESATRAVPAVDTKPNKPEPTPLHTNTTASKSKESPTSTKKSPVSQKKDSPTTTNESARTIKPRGGVNKITGIIESSNRAKEERAKAAHPNSQDPSSGPTIKPRGGANKIIGIIESSNRAKEERAKVEQSASPTAPSGPAIKPRGGPNKIAGIIQSSKKAKEERAKAEQHNQSDVPEGKSAASREIKPPSVASKPTAASRAHAQKQEKQDKLSAADQVKPPTTTRPTKLPSAATAGTAASAARKGANTTDDESKPTTSERRSILPQPPRVADISTRSSLAKKSSRTSLANGEDRPRSRVSAAHKPADEGFLARMTRPTAASARRAQDNAQDKAQVGSPPRARQTSANHEAIKKPGRKSLSTTSKPAPADEANETLLEPVNEDTAAIMIEPTEQDEGEPGPAEEEEEVGVFRQPQPAAVDQTTL